MSIKKSGWITCCHAAFLLYFKNQCQIVSAWS